MRVRFERVTKRFGDHIAADAIDLDVDAGECLVLLGPSGCGKTTLLRLLAGLEHLDAGAIWIGDRRVDAVDPAKRDVAMVFQNYALYPHLTVFDNIAFPLRTRQTAPAEIDRRVRQAAARVGLDSLLSRRPAQLSGGQQQRVALARAIVRNPTVYLMDEPLSNLDAQLRVQTRTELKRLHRELGTTMLYVTHDQGEAMTLGSRIAVMQAGRIVQIGRPLDLYRAPATKFVATFLGSPAMNILPSGFGGHGVGDEVEIGIRPEDVAVQSAPAPGWFEARVVAAEPMGNETLLTFERDGVRFVARAAADLAGADGRALFVRVPPERTLLFDRRSGLRKQETTEVTE